MYEDLISTLFCREVKNFPDAGPFIVARSNVFYTEWRNDEPHFKFNTAVYPNDLYLGTTVLYLLNVIFYCQVLCHTLTLSASKFLYNIPYKR